MTKSFSPTRIRHLLEVFQQAPPGQLAHDRSFSERILLGWAAETSHHSSQSIQEVKLAGRAASLGIW